MGFNEFWLNLNGKKQQIGDVKQGVRKEQVDQKFHNLFDAYDVNQDGTLEEKELTGIFKGLSKFAGADKVLDSKENAQVKSVFSQQVNIQDADFQGFVKSISDASADIKSTKTTATLDGGKEVRTEYADGTVETISYYPDGDYKFKKTELHKETVTYTVAKKEYTRNQLEQKLKKEYNNYKQRQANSVATDTMRASFTMDYDTFKKDYLQKHKVTPRPSKIDIDNLDLSERAKQDIEVRDFVLNHYIETHKAAKEALESMGILDDAGALINAGAGELWNTIKNKWNGTEEEYQNFYELKEKFEPNYNKSLSTSGSLEVMRNHPENYFRGFEKAMPNYTLEKGVTFQAKTEQYQNATILKQRIDILKKAMQEVEQYSVDQGLLLHSPGTSEGINPASHIVKANELLLQYFGGDQEAVNMLLNGAMSDNNSKVVQAIKDIYNDTQTMNETVLGGKSFDEIEGEYKAAYKEMYGTDFVPDELTEKVMDAKATGSFVKLAAITIVSILVTRSPIMAEISGAAAGSAEATGAAANLMRTLVTKYGQTAVQQGIKFAMTSGTLATDVGLTLLNQVTSERGVNGEELWESTKSSAKYIYFGAYIGAPVAEAVGNAVGKIGLAKGLMNGGATTTQGAIKTTTLTGDKVFENILNTGKNVGQKLAVGSAKIGTDIAMFSALGIATDGQEVGEAFAEQSTFLPKLKIMNHVLEYALGRMMGGKAGAQAPLMSRPRDLRMEEAIKRSGINDWTIKEMKSPSGTRYTVIDDKGIPLSFNDANRIVTAMMEKVAQAYETVKIDTPETQVKAENNEDVSIPTQAEVKQMNFDEMFARLKNGHVNYTLSTTEDGRKLVKIEDYKTPSSNRFDYYEFDNEGKLVKSQVKTSEATAKDLFKGFENAETKNIHNRGGRLNVGVPIMDMAESVDAAITARNVRNEVGNNDVYKPKHSPEEFLNLMSKLEDVPLDEVKQEDRDIVINYYKQHAEIFDIILDNSVAGNSIHLSDEVKLKLIKGIDLEECTPEQVKDFMILLHLSKNSESTYNKDFGISEEHFNYLKLLNKNRLEIQGNWEYDNGLPAGIDDCAFKEPLNPAQDKLLIQLLKDGYINYDYDFSKTEQMQFNKIKTDKDAITFINLINELEQTCNMNRREALANAFLSTTPEYKDLTIKLNKLIEEKNYGVSSYIMLLANNGAYDRIVDIINKVESGELNGVDLSYLSNIGDKFKNATPEEFAQAQRIGLWTTKKLSANDINKLLRYGKIQDILNKIEDRNLLNLDFNCSAEGIIALAHFQNDEYVNRLMEKHIPEKFNDSSSWSFILQNYDELSQKGLLEYTKFDEYELERAFRVVYHDFEKVKNIPELKEVQAIGLDGLIDLAKCLGENPDFNNSMYKFAKMLCSDKTMNLTAEQIKSIYNSSCREIQRMHFSTELLKNKDFPREYIANIVGNIRPKVNIDFARELCNDETFPKEYISGIIFQCNELKIDFAKQLCNDKDFPPKNISNILEYIRDEQTLKFASKLCSIKDFPKDKIADLLSRSRDSEVKMNFALELCSDNSFPKNEINRIISNITEQNVKLARELCANKEFPKNIVAQTIASVNSSNIELARELCNNSNIDKEYIGGIVSSCKLENGLVPYDENHPDYDPLIEQKEKCQLVLDIVNDKSLNCPVELLSQLVANYKQGTTNIVKDYIKDGLLDKYPALAKYQTNIWENIKNRNLLADEVYSEDLYPSGFRDAIIEVYANAKNDNIVQEHRDLVHDAFENIDLLKTGVDDLSNDELQATMMCQNAIKALDFVGKGNLEAAFPLMIDEFGEFILEMANLELPKQCREALVEKINPTQCPAYKDLYQSITNLKQKLNEVIGKEKLAEIKRLQAERDNCHKEVENIKKQMDELFRASEEYKPVQEAIDKKLKDKINETTSKQREIWLNNNPEAKALLKQLQAMQKQEKSYNGQAQSLYFQGENTAIVKDLMKQISSNSKELQRILDEKSCHLEPQEVVTKMRVLSALTEISTQEEIAEFIDLIKPSTPDNDASWNEAVNKKIYQKLGIEYDEALSQKLDLIHCKYISKLFISSEEFFENMKILAEVIKENPNMTIEQAFDQMPQNLITREMLKSIGIDYDKYTKVDKNSFTKVEVKLNAEEAKQAAIQNLETDFNSDEFKSLPKEVTDPIFKALEEELGVTLVKSQKDNWSGDGFAAGTSEYYRLYKNGKPVEFEEMKYITSVIKNQIKNNEFWRVTHSEPSINSARGTMYTHLMKMLEENVEKATNIKDDETVEIEIRKTDMYDVKKAIGLGNDGQCCTALGRNFNEWSAPTYIMNKCIGAIEVTDKTSFVGNTMIYFANVDGKPALVLDNIELKTKYQYNDKIRDAILDYAKKLCEEIGQPDLPIFAGPNRHKLTMDIYPKSAHEMEIIGNSADQTVYVDYDASSHYIGNGEKAKIQMYKLR